MKKLSAAVVLFALALFLSQAVVADTVQLKDGSRITGKLTEKGNKVELDTRYGRLVIDRADIESIEEDSADAPKPPAITPRTSLPDDTDVTVAKIPGAVKESILDSVKSTDLSRHVRYLASEELQGRATGTEGGKLARDYIVKQFKSYGLQAGGDTETYTQKFPTHAGDSWNVVGYIEGSDPVMKTEVVVVGAHYDHVGKGGLDALFGGGSGKVCPGADDNASGTAGVLEVAQAFTEKGIKPKRTVLFICFGSEEIGLVGSRFYCKHPTFPLEKTVAMFCMDMISRNAPNEVTVMGVTLSAQLDKIVDEANCSRLKIKKRGMSFGSDHNSFYPRGVPALLFFTGIHRDLHRSTDTPDKCNFKKAEKIAELVALTAFGSANFQGKIEMEKSKGGLGNFAGIEGLENLLGGFKGLEGLLGGGRRRLLGITFNVADLTGEKKEKFGLGKEESGILITNVRSGSVAEKGVLEQGDIIIEFNGTKVPSRRSGGWLRRMIKDAPKGEEIPYTVIRNGRKKTGTVTFTR